MAKPPTTRFKERGIKGVRLTGYKYKLPARIATPRLHRDDEAMTVEPTKCEQNQADLKLTWGRYLGYNESPEQAKR